MSQKPLLEVCLSPALLHLYDTRDTLVVIIDVFRATSTIAAALHNGATRVIPIASVEDCIATAATISNCITAGERDGKVVPGLQYGNSPLEYVPEFIRGKTLALTTTNGTKLLHMVQEADQIITGAFLNLDAVIDYLRQRNQKVLLACAAWKDRVNMEDTLFAGAVAHRLQDTFRLSCDSALIAATFYQQASTQENLLAALKGSSHYARLSGYGLQRDLEYCTTPNLHPVVPLYDGTALIVA